MTLARMVAAWMACAAQATQDQTDQNTVRRYKAKVKATQDALDIQQGRGRNVRSGLDMRRSTT